VKTTFKTIILAAACATAMGAAQAETMTAQLGVGESITAFGYKLSELTGGGTLTFSKSLIGALNAGGVKVAAIAPADVVTTGATTYKSVIANAPVTSLKGTYDSVTKILQVEGVNTAGGATLTSTADDFTNTGGFLKISNISVDVQGGKVYADISGDNGVQNLSHYQVWNFGSITGATSFPAVEGVTVSQNQVSKLTITPDAFNLFAQGLGLTDAGIGAMKLINDYGTMDSKISVLVTAVPEPSAVVLSGLGMLVLAGVRRSKKAAKQA